MELSFAPHPGKICFYVQDALHLLSCCGMISSQQYSHFGHVIQIGRDALQETNNNDNNGESGNNNNNNNNNNNSNNGNSTTS